MSITAGQVKELRDRTNAGMLDCKKALEENEGNFDKAVEWLRTKGIAKAGKKAGRVAAEGMVHSYIHGGRVGVLIEVNSETDFAARNEQFQNLVADLALHIAAMAPRYVSMEDIPQSAREEEGRILKAKALEEGKKPEMVDKIVDGQLNKWGAEICLMNQKFVKNPEQTVEQMFTDVTSKIGEKIVVRRFVRYELGEGIEKKQENFADEVAKQLKG